ncbi:CFA77 protein, partial [Alcedo cyanopectus]|nr:CFA77 protein [Ceyx cyanopectus]
QAEVGKPQSNCYTLPGLDFSYGLYIQRTDGGVPEAIGHWNTVKPRTASTQEMPRDYIRMNCDAVKAGYTTAREFNLYYKARDLRRKESKGFHFDRSLPKVPPGFTYGIKSRPSTPLFDLLQHKYKELWMEHQRVLTAALRMEKKKVIILQARDNRTSLLRKQPQPEKVESFWHLPHLEKVEPHLSTFPDPDARKKAFSA